MEHQAKKFTLVSPIHTANHTSNGSILSGLPDISSEEPLQLQIYRMEVAVALAMTVGFMQVSSNSIFALFWTAAI